IKPFLWVDCLLSGKILLRRTTETEAIIRFQPVERGGFVRVKSELLTGFDEVSALLRIVHHAVAVLIIRPVLDFRCRLGRAIGQQPGADLIIIFRGFYSGFEVLTRAAPSHPTPAA